MDQKEPISYKPPSNGKDFSYNGAGYGGGRRYIRRYSDVVKGHDSSKNGQGEQLHTNIRKNGNNGFEETRIIEVDTDEKTKDILKRSLIGKAKNYDHLDNLVVICKDIELANSQIKHIGGKEVLLVLDNDEAADAIVENTKHEIRQWLWNLRKWDEFYSPEDIVELDITKESASNDSSEPGDAENYLSEEDGSSSNEEDGVADNPNMGMDQDVGIHHNSLNCNIRNEVEGHQRPDVTDVDPIPEEPKVVFSTFEEEIVKPSNLENTQGEGRVDNTTLDPFSGLDLNLDPNVEPTSSIGPRDVRLKVNNGKGSSSGIPFQGTTQTPFPPFAHSSFSLGVGLTEDSKRKFSGGVKERIPFDRNKIWNERIGNNFRRAKIPSSTDHISPRNESCRRKKPRTSMSLGLSSSEVQSRHSTSLGDPLDPKIIINLVKKIGFTWENSVGVQDQMEPPTGGQL
ncbi:hypothetical protein L6452_16573 [Arctium lappa]|uniref:Uncharacterized protein n=1 Tax=Arctium lappa TaxID=4217 RepID=A0ACB9C160_ARCLA|nr:hypothetical protein L6452_16573 [Arctium lappa]